MNLTKQEFARFKKLESRMGDLSKSEYKEFKQLETKLKMSGNGDSNNRDSYKKDYDSKTYVKKSGAGFKQAAAKSGKGAGELKPITYGWRAVKKHGIIKYFCAPTKYSKQVQSKSGNTWITGISITVTDVKLSSKSLAWGMMHLATGKVICKDLGLVINPKGGRGGVVAFIGKNS